MSKRSGLAGWRLVDRMESGSFWHGGEREREKKKRRSTGWHGVPPPGLHFMCPQATELGRSRRSTVIAWVGWHPWTKGERERERQRDRAFSGFLLALYACV